MADVSSLLASHASSPLLAARGGELTLRDYINTLPVSAGKDRTLLLYFSASWCGPCKVFTPQLSALFTSLVSFGVVFISADSSRSDFDAYRAKMPWPAALHKSALAKALDSEFSVNSFPTLVALSLTPSTSPGSIPSPTEPIQWRAVVSNPNAYPKVSSEGAASYPWSDPTAAAAAATAAAAAAASSSVSADAGVGEGGAGVNGLWVGALSGPPLPLRLLPLPVTTQSSSSSSSSSSGTPIAAAPAAAVPAAGSHAAAARALVSRRIHLAAAARYCSPPKGASSLTAKATEIAPVVVGARRYVHFNTFLTHLSNLHIISCLNLVLTLYFCPF